MSHLPPSREGMTLCSRGSVQASAPHGGAPGPSRCATEGLVGSTCHVTYGSLAHLHPQPNTGEETRWDFLAFILSSEKTRIEKFTSHMVTIQPCSERPSTQRPPSPVPVQGGLSHDGHPFPRTGTVSRQLRRCPEGGTACHTAGQSSQSPPETRLAGLPDSQDSLRSPSRPTLGTRPTKMLPGLCLVAPAVPHRAPGHMCLSSGHLKCGWFSMQDTLNNFYVNFMLKS